MRLFKKKKDIIKIRGLYAVTKGLHVGSYYLFIAKIGPKYSFSVLPDFKTVVLDEFDVKIGVEKKVLDLVKILDQKTFDSCIKEHFGREKINEPNPRQQQSYSQSILGSKTTTTNKFKG